MSKYQSIPNSSDRNQTGRVDISSILNEDPHAKDMEEGHGGKIYRLKGLNPWAKAFLLTACVQVLIVIALTIQRMSIISWPFTDATRADFTYAVVLLLNTLFACYYAVHSCLRERKIELIGFVVASIVVSTYVVYQFAFGGSDDSDPAYAEDWKASRLARFILICIFEPISLILAFIVQRKFGWVAFKTVGANEELIKMYTNYSMFVAFIKFDLQCGLSLEILSLFSRLKVDYDMGIDLGALVLTLAIFIIGWTAARWESHIGMNSLIYSSVLTFAYAGYKIYRMIEDSEDVSQFARYAILIAVGLLIAVRIVVIILGVRVKAHFGKGLKSLIGHHHHPSHHHGQQQPSQPQKLFYGNERQSLLNH